MVLIAGTPSVWTHLKGFSFTLGLWYDNMHTIAGVVKDEFIMMTSNKRFSERISR
jgi:hypothetical protein